jgi:hypothetical protein
VCHEPILEQTILALNSIREVLRKNKHRAEVTSFGRGFDKELVRYECLGHCRICRLRKEQVIQCEQGNSELVAETGERKRTIHA